MYERNLELGEAPGVSSCPGKKKMSSHLDQFLSVQVYPEQGGEEAGAGPEESAGGVGGGAGPEEGG